MAGHCLRLLCQALRGEDLTVFGDGSQTRSFCFVQDMIDGIIACFFSGYWYAGKYWKPG